MKEAQGIPNEQIGADSIALATKAGDTFEILKTINSDIADQIGKIVDEDQLISDETRVMSEVADIPTKFITQYQSVAQKDKDNTVVLSPLNSSVKQYYRFFDTLKGSRGEIEEQVAALIKTKPQLEPFLTYLYAVNPVMATAASLVYEQPDSQKQSQLEKTETSINWFSESIDNAANVYTHVNGVFSQLKARCLGEAELGPQGLQSFLEDWKKDIDMHIAECVNLAVCTAIHIQEEDCAVLTSYLNIPVRSDKFNAARESVLQLMGGTISNDKIPLYRKYSPTLSQHLQQLNPMSGYVTVPTYSSFIDISDFFKSYSRFWGSLNQVLETQQPRITQKNGTFYAKIGGAATFLIRPEPQLNKQARISILGEGEFNGFGIRIDKEETRSRLALDIGGVSFEPALDYANEIKQKDAEGQECIMNYSEIIDPTGAIRKKKRPYYPSIMRSGSNLTVGEKFALMIGLSMQEGAAVGMRESDFFLYHSQGESTKQEYYDTFPRLAHQMVSMLKRKPKI